MSETATAEAHARTLSEPDNERVIFRVDPKRVMPLPGQPRKKFDQQKIERLSHSIKAAGQRTPVEVSKLEGNPNFDWQLVDGERRLRACQWGEHPFIKVFITDDDGRDTFLKSVVANFCREEHTPMEIADACGVLQASNHTIEQIAASIGRSVPSVCQYLRLLKLHPDLQSLTDRDQPKEKRLPVQAALILTKVKPEKQLEAVETLGNKPRTAANISRVINEMLDAQADAKNPEIDSRPRRTSDHVDTIFAAIRTSRRVLAKLRELPLRTITHRIIPAKKKEILELLGELWGDVEGIDDCIRDEVAKKK